MVSGIAADTRIYAQLAQVPQSQFNPLQQMAQFQNILQGQQSMQIQREQFGMQKEKFELEKQALAAKAQELEREQQKEQAIAEIAQSSVNPETGQLDWLRFMNQILENPMTAADAPDLAFQAIQARQLEAVTATEMFELEMEKRSRRAQAAAALVQQFPQKGKSIPNEALVSTMADLENDGIVTREETMQILTGLAEVPEGPERDQLVERIALQEEEGRAAVASGLERMQAGLELQKTMGELEKQQREFAAAEQEARHKASTTAQRAAYATRDAMDAIALLPEVPDSPAGRFLLANAPWQNPTREFAGHMTSIQDSIAAIEYLGIREAGVTLGQVPQAQWESLSRLVGNLDLGAPKHVLERNLRDLVGVYSDILSKLSPEQLQDMDLVQRELERSRALGISPQLPPEGKYLEGLDTGLGGVSTEQLIEDRRQMMQQGVR